jgi:ATP-dependent DNA helicase RecG
MTKEEKDLVMEDYVNNKINILISTTVVEVGVDVSNATVIVIFDSDRFGLSTLHQLRGRVGRNNMQSYCYLISDKDKKRLDIMEQENDGYKISEEDFKLRGQGDLFGSRQSGALSFKLSDIKKDYDLIVKVKEDVEKEGK